MSGYISRAACKGHRPSCFASYNGYERPALIGSLLKDRDVARYLVAPSGYGKTWAAVEYAETMFSWQHTFWLNAQSPCFIRDLDNQDIASACTEYDPQASLVVFDDLPVLDTQRNEAFSQTLDELLQAGCEVLVTCTPLHDMADELQPDRICVGPRGLLLNDDELDAFRASDDKLRRPSTVLSAAERIPSVVWKGEAAHEEFVRQTLREEMPRDVLLAMGSMLVAVHGPFTPLMHLVGLNANQVHDMLKSYPHLSINADADTFQAPLFSLNCLARAIAGKLEDMALGSSYGSADELVNAWAGYLMHTGQEARACQLIQQLYSPRKRGEWLVGNAWNLVRASCFVAANSLAESNGCEKGEVRQRVRALHALCKRMLGDNQGALACAKQCAFDESAEEAARVIGLIIVAELAPPPVQERANEELHALVQAPELAPQHSLVYRQIAQAWCARQQGAYQLAELWQHYQQTGVSNDVVALCAAWLFNTLAATTEPSDVQQAQITACARYVRGQLEQDAQSTRNFFIVSAGLALQEARERGVAATAGPVKAATGILLREAELGLAAQRALYQDEQVAEARRRHSWIQTHPHALLAQQDGHLKTLTQQHVPVLSVRLFGQLDVSIGDTMVDRSSFSRATTRNLLVLLAVNHGREVPRERIIRAMWPHSDEVRGKKNFYSAWSCLRKALSLPDGTCPYLIRHQYGCSLEHRYVKSDVARLDDLCRELLFGTPDMKRWAQIYSEIDRDYSSDLMPCEVKNSLIVEMRRQYRNKLVDALVSAALAVLPSNAPQWGIWFASAALNHDETREDAYVAMMKAQIASNQRTAAMMTFLKCRSVLADQLGIDPSAETVALYEKLLQANDSE